MLKRELKINLKSLIIWTSIMVAVYILVFAVYPSIIETTNSQMLNEMLKAFPEEMLEMFNMDISGIDSVFGWIKTEGYTFFTLIGGIYAAILGSTILIKEESDKTIEFLYSKPISRNKIVTSKILAGVINIFLFTVIITIVNLIGLYLSDDLELKLFLMLSLAPILLFYMLFFISLFVSTFFRKTKQTMMLGISITFIAYLMQILGGMSENIKILQRISLFEFISARPIILNETIDFKYLYIGIGIILITTIGTYIRYNKKELV